MEELYNCIEHIAELYTLLEDNLSKEIFWARLRHDCDWTLENASRLFCLADDVTEEEKEFRHKLKSIFEQLNKARKKIFLYGAGVNGRVVGELLLQETDFFGYCARNPEKHPNGVLGKPVFSPAYLLEHADESYVLISTSDYLDEIYEYLADNQFPKDHILPFCKPDTNNSLMRRQYFDFPELFPKGKAFIDAGCFDCATSIQFSQWCQDEYSKIIAFEPDTKNYMRCQDIMKSSGLRMELICACLNDCPGYVNFSSEGTGTSWMISSEATQANAKFNDETSRVPETEISVEAVTLDNVVGNTEVGFIKMDIEGSELSALYGAKNTILRDKPLLAICVYHRKGDILAIMDFLYKLIPQYRFYVRHYGTMVGGETVLYASVMPNVIEKGK